MKKQILTVLATTLALTGCADLCEVDTPCSLCEADTTYSKTIFTSDPTLFAFDSAVLSPKAERSLAPVVKELKETGKHALIKGYTDITGNAAYNVHLSEERAKAVAKYLVEKGVDAKNLSAQGFGATNFVATNETSAGRAKNRRVTIVVD